MQNKKAPNHIRRGETSAIQTLRGKPSITIRTASHRLLPYPSSKEVLVQYVVDDVGMNFDTRIVNFSVRRGAQIADASCRCSDDNNLVLKGSGRTFVRPTTSAME